MKKPITQASGLGKGPRPGVTEASQDPSHATKIHKDEVFDTLFVKNFSISFIKKIIYPIFCSNYLFSYTQVYRWRVEALSSGKLSRHGSNLRVNIACNLECVVKGKVLHEEKKYTARFRRQFYSGTRKIRVQKLVGEKKQIKEKASNLVKFLQI